MGAIPAGEVRIRDDCVRYSSIQTMLHSTNNQNRNGRVVLAACLVLGAAGAPAFAQEASEPLESDPIVRALKEGKVNLNLRARYSYADINGDMAPDEAHAYTLRTLLGYTTGKLYGFDAKVEMVDVRTIDEETYNGVVTGDSTESVIADPQTTELNQAFLRYSSEYGLAAVGRQRYILGNARFIGNVGWRQNEQTYDMALARLTPLDGLSVEYAFIDGVNRIFADERDWSSDSHIFHASYNVADFLSVTLYDYYLDLRGPGGPGDFNTFGGYVSGSVPIGEEFKIDYRGELAYQWHNNKSENETYYYHLYTGVSYRGFGISAGYEVLGSDDGEQQFLTPLATAHKFNGFADAYLNNNGPEGLEDLYLTASAKIVKLKLAATYHWFFAHEDLPGDGEDDAQEFDFVISYPITEYLSVLGKAAIFEAEAAGAPVDRQRYTLEATVSF